MNNSIKNSIENALKDLKLRYEYDEKLDGFVFSMSINNVGPVKTIIKLFDDCYAVCVTINKRVPSSKIKSVGEYLHRANYGMLNGNFEFDYNDGEVGYKTFVNCRDSMPSVNIVKDSIVVPFVMIDKYGEGLMNVIEKTAKPEEQISKIERQL